MKAIDLLFPVPRQILASKAVYKLPQALELAGQPMPEFLYERLQRACALSRMTCNRKSGKSRKGSTTLTCVQQAVNVKGVSDPDLLTQAYSLELRKDGRIELCAPSSEGMRHGIITLCLLLEAAAHRTELTAMTIQDAPAFKVRTAPATD